MTTTATETNIIREIDQIGPIVFHYNKKHNEDQAIPPWIIKAKGETFYINHMEIQPGVGFSTKETPDNPHTKASLKIKGRLRIFETEDGKIEATIY